MEQITLNPGESIRLVIDSQTVCIKHFADGDGHAVELSGVDCNLEGELPGLYYVVPLAHAAIS